MYGVSCMHRHLRIVGGWCVYSMQHGMLLLPWLMKGRKIECKKNKMNLVL